MRGNSYKNNFKLIFLVIFVCQLLASLLYFSLVSDSEAMGPNDIRWLFMIPMMVIGPIATAGPLILSLVFFRSIWKKTKNIFIALIPAIILASYYVVIYLMSYLKLFVLGVDPLVDFVFHIYAPIVSLISFMTTFMIVKNSYGKEIETS